ncbi:MULTISPECIES: hypothetical protein [Stutzerimonas stutzeri subgroup]|uniref:Uncharacterized protein n=1 Tax=Stutzerimonas stutzeri NF13 TaxID=1212548 RepID=M2TSB9_STUST|nr:MULTISPECIES: hypothetical protein [Stutzerimonas stutzeri subgroup]MBS69289.1 hypothetical protein [Pseudomonas sp.]WOF79657.1 hypothetical protein P5704_003935 [Pseudomonas sp. FeN3W]EME00226.1 hypothetical protein B381_10363 [Stutzerimonas stutzeri NF13]MBK3883266.1 hypothetical protein [Stutzerimonas stutzeri]MCQ4290767.1 hypothetical protein [Stutzerimonas stutzeri]|tara:strand:- start:339 stop:614 length:276 start_codon:yes stop_codon:yes gene_type:complete
MSLIKILSVASSVLFCTAVLAAPSLEALQKEGERDGKRYAQDGRNNGIKVDAAFCAVGMAAEDESRPELAQKEIEAYAKAFGNACMGRKVF